MKKIFLVATFLWAASCRSMHPDINVAELRIEARQRNGALPDTEAAAILKRYRALLASHVISKFREETHFFLQIANTQHLERRGTLTEAQEYISLVIANIKSCEGDFSADARLKKKNNKDLLANVSDLSVSADKVADYFAYVSTRYAGLVARDRLGQMGDIVKSS